jgi:predicted phosphodiesterase
MKIAVASDIHLEFGDLEIVNDQNAQVLILSGDILVARDITQQDPYGIMGPEYRSNRYHDFMQRCSAQFPHVIYIMGNHEHYNGDFATTEKHKRCVGLPKMCMCWKKKQWSLMTSLSLAAHCGPT